jgi:tetratricopeptide (TPR) repeat protein
MIGERETGTKRLEEAVDTLRKAQLEQTREDTPLDWAMTQNNLGIAFSIMAERESDPKRWEEAVSAFRQALLERTRERVPEQWAKTQNNLGNALQRLGELRKEKGLLCEALLTHLEAFQGAQGGEASQWVVVATLGIKKDLAALESAAKKPKPAAKDAKPTTKKPKLDCPEVPNALWEAYQATQP